jgi:hypothetical protein
MLAHVVTARDTGPGPWLLKRYARHEVRLLSIFYQLLGSRAMRNTAVSEAVYWTLAYPSARWAIAGTPLAPTELPGFIGDSARLAVGPCRCRLAHGGCDHPIETDIVVRTGFPIWTGLFPGDYREITAGEALDICNSAHEKGLSQIAYAHLDIAAGGTYFVICNCCKDGCLPLLARAHYGGERIPFHRGKSRAYVETAKCERCGACVEICPFGQRSMAAAGPALVGSCYGCGLCASHCAAGVSSML